MINLYHYHVAQIFSEAVEEFPDRKALIWDCNNYVIYSDLERISNQIAHYLLDIGVKKGDRVCIILDKVTVTYGIILASLKIGTPYFVVDPANPAARTKYIIEKCQPSIVFVHHGLNLEDFTGKVVYVNEKQNGFFKDCSTDKVNTGWRITGSDPAYIMFTSGSTGFPKGVVISHDNLINFIKWSQWRFGFSANDIFTNVNPLYFDNSVFDIYSSLFCGAALAPFDSTISKDSYQVMRKIDELQCTVYFSFPSLLIYFQILNLFNSQSFKSVKKIIFGGEGYPKSKLKELYDCLGDRITFYNVYGPTECTCICSVYELSETDFTNLEGLPPLGTLTPNFSYLIINENGSLVDKNEIGELCLSGPCVGLGYFNDPDQTRTLFVQNPLNNAYHERIYKTGDLVRYNTDDNKLYFSGRKDSQIKHRGYRIEMAEIEHALTSVPHIDEAVALQSHANGISIIIATVATKQSIGADYIKSEASRFIPKYMIPEKIEILEQLPKNANGKIDRNLLQTKYCS